MPGDTIHAGGFCFGKKEPLPSPPNKTKKSVTTDNEHLFQNHHLHFSLLCSDLAYKVATGQETNITLVGDNNGNLYKDFWLMKVSTRIMVLNSCFVAILPFLH